MSAEGKRSKSSTKGKGSHAFYSSLIDDDAPTFPERTPFSPSIASLRAHDEYIAAYERDVLYEEERSIALALIPPCEDDLQMPLDVISGEEGAAAVSCQDFFSQQWESAFAKYQQTYEKEKDAGFAEFTVAPSARRQEIPTKVATSFKHIFPNSEIIVRDAEQGVTAEVICEYITREVVAKAAELYAARCFDSIREGYAAFSIWEEVRTTVAQAFLPMDYAQLRLQTAPARQAPQQQGGVAYPTQLSPHGHFDMLSPSTPFHFMLGATERVRLAAKGVTSRLVVPEPSTVDETNAGPGAPPAGVGVDDYCRYVVPTEKKPPASASVNIQEGASPRKKLPRASSVGISARVSQHGSEANIGHQLQPPRVTRTATRKKKITTKTPGSTSLETEERHEVDHSDNLTVAMRTVPLGYFSVHRSVLSSGSSDPEERALANRERPDEDVSLKKKGTVAMKSFATSGVVDVEGNKLIPQVNVNIARNRNFEQRKRYMIRRGSDRRPLEHAVTYNLISSAPPVEPDREGPVMRSPLRSSPAFVPRTSKLKKSERRRQQELEEQRRYEKRFVVIPELTEEERVLREQQITLTPQPGVSLQQIPIAEPPSTRRRLVRNPRKDEPVVLADGGQYVTPRGRQRWVDYKAKAEARGVTDGGLARPQSTERLFASATSDRVGMVLRENAAKTLSGGGSSTTRLPRLPIISN